MRERDGRRCPHKAVHECPLYWAMHDGLGGSCWPADDELQTGCAVEKGASYDKIFATWTPERYVACGGVATSSIRH